MRSDAMRTLAGYGPRRRAVLRERVQSHHVRSHQPIHRMKSCAGNTVQLIIFGYGSTHHSRRGAVLMCEKGHYHEVRVESAHRLDPNQFESKCAVDAVAERVKRRQYGEAEVTTDARRAFLPTYQRGTR